MSMVIARCYPWGASDTITAYLTTDAEGNYDLDNVKDANLTRRGRATTRADSAGFLFALTSSVSLCCVEMVNTDMVATEDIKFDAASSATYTPPTSRTLGTAFDPAVLSEIYTQHSYVDEVPSRSNFIVGYDTFTTGPTPAAAITTVACQSGRVNWQNSVSGSYWELGFLALGIGGKDITNPDQIEARRVALRHGFGWSTRCSWSNVPNTDATALETLWAATHEGSLPCFVFPQPGSKTSSGTITDATITPACRGGLVRLLSFGYSESASLGDTDRVPSMSLEMESWQEVPID